MKALNFTDVQTYFVVLQSTVHLFIPIHHIFCIHFPLPLNPDTVQFMIFRVFSSICLHNFGVSFIKLKITFLVK